jgi:tRNA threonylcarbamoyladenosine modification (KEOPS) complex  Pcc1 subunit
VRRLQATLILEYKDDRTAEAVAEAVSPDNFKAPVGLQVNTARDGNKVVTEIGWEGNLATFTATINDLLFSVSIAEKMLFVVDKF